MRKTHLPRVLRFTIQDPLGSYLDVAVRVHNHRTLAAQLESDRGEIPRCSGCNDASDGSSASIHDMIPAKVQQSGCLWHSTSNHSIRRRIQIFGNQ